MVEKIGGGVFFFLLPNSRNTSFFFLNYDVRLERVYSGVNLREYLRREKRRGPGKCGKSSSGISNETKGNPWDGIPLYVPGTHARCTR